MPPFDALVVIPDGLNPSRAYDTIGLLSRELNSLHHLAKSALNLQDFKTVRYRLTSIPSEGDVKHFLTARFDGLTTCPWALTERRVQKVFVNSLKRALSQVFNAILNVLYLTRTSLPSAFCTRPTSFPIGIRISKPWSTIT